MTYWHKAQEMFVSVCASGKNWKVKLAFNKNKKGGSKIRNEIIVVKNHLLNIHTANFLLENHETGKSKHFHFPQSTRKREEMENDRVSKGSQGIIEEKWNGFLKLDLGN